MDLLAAVRLGGIVSHAIKLFGLVGFLGSDWEKKKIQEEMDKMDDESA